MSGHEGVQTSALFSPNSQYVLTTSNDKTARIWDVKSGNELTYYQMQHDEAIHYAKRGQKWRVFMRTPIHDSFRLTPQIKENMVKQGINIKNIPFNWICGCQHENRITMRFWIVTLITAAIAILTCSIAV